MGYYVGANSCLDPSCSSKMKLRARTTASSTSFPSASSFCTSSYSSMFSPGFSSTSSFSSLSSSSSSSSWYTSSFLSSSSSSSSSSSTSSFLLPFPRLTISSIHHRLLLCVLLMFVLRVPIGAAGVQVHNVNVPNPGIVGRPAHLECLWDAGVMGFYSVRWYKNGEQFYSFVPKNTPQVKVDHHLRGVTVELTQSDEHRVTLRELRLDSDGVYRCEVMSEAPTFQTSFASSNMTVVVMPEAPVLKGLRGVYRVGDILNVTCTARDAFPHATLTFHVNGRLVHPGSGRVQELPTTEGTYPGVYSSTSRLVLPLSEHHAPTLSLVCYAHVLSLSVPIEASIKVEPPRTPILSFFNAAGGGPGAPYLASLLLGICLTHRLLLPCLLLSCTSTS